MSDGEIAPEQIGWIGAVRWRRCRRGSCDGITRERIMGPVWLGTRPTVDQRVTLVAATGKLVRTLSRLVLGARELAATTRIGQSRSLGVSRGAALRLPVFAHAYERCLVRSVKLSRRLCQRRIRGKYASGTNVPLPNEN